MLIGKKEPPKFPLPECTGLIYFLLPPQPLLTPLLVSLYLLCLVISLILSSFWHSASSFHQCLVFCPVGHTNFGGWQWEPASVVWHVDSNSLTPALLEERGLLDSRELQPSLLAQTEGSTVVVLWNPNWNGNGRQSGAGCVRFPLSEKFALLTFGNHTLAFHRGHLCISLWICKMHIFGLPQECFMGSFYILKVSTGLLVL